MIGMTMRQATGGFFDRVKVKNAMDAATRRVLSKFGAFVRQRAISSILRHKVRSFGMKSKVKNRQGVSRPGQPPFTHTGMLPKGIFFVYEEGLRPNVVIGPVRLKQRPRANRPMSGTVPNVLEEGGTIQLKQRGKSRLARIQARPYMSPAFEREKALTLPKLWLNSVK